MKQVNYISFIHPVSIGGEFHAINAYSHDKHSKHMEVVEKGPWLTLVLKTGGQRRIPMSNIAFISDVEVEEKKA